MAKNIQMNVLGSDGQYEDIYPQTTVENIVDIQNNYYTKNETLTNTTAALFDLGGDAVPDDVLNVLSRFQSGLGNEYLWLAYKETWELSEVTVPLIGRVPYDDPITYYDSVNFDSASGTISGVGSHTFQPTSYSDSAWNQIVGKYCTFSYIENGYPVGTYFKIDSRTSNSDSKFSGKALVPARTSREEKFVNSANQDAYPPAIPDGYTYTSLGQIGNKVQIETGSYVGTGTYGQNNPNTLTFGFEPEIVFISSNYDNNNGQFCAVFFTSMLKSSFVNYGWFDISGISSFNPLNGQHWARKSDDGKTLIYYSGNSSAAYQGNASGVTYYYIALG